MAGKTVKFRVIGEQTIHCTGCEQRIDHALQRVQGVDQVHASAQTQEVEVTIDPVQVGPEQVQARLERMGYQVLPQGS